MDPPTSRSAIINTVTRERDTAGLRRLRVLVLFIVVAAGFFIIRMTQGLVWNDSPQTAENLYGFGEDLPAGVSASPPICRDEGAFGLRWRDRGVMTTILRRAFSCLEFGGYRPLSAALSLTGVAIFTDVYAPDLPKPYLGTIWIAGVACLFGALALLLFAVTRGYVKHDITACVVVLLFFFSPPVVSGAWILFSGGIQVTVPLFICLTLWLYRRCRERTARTGWWTAALVVVLFVGPWIREYIALSALLVVVLELQLYRRATAIAVVALLAFCHALLPTAAVALFAPRLPVVPVFRLGSLGAQIGMGSGTLLDALAQVKWDVAPVFLLTLPPILFVLCTLTLLISLKWNATSLTAVGGSVAAAALSARQPWFWLMLIAGFCVLTIVHAASNRGRANGLDVQKVLFLNIWFLLSLFPFFKVFSEHVHLAYPLIPALILIAASTEHFWTAAGTSRVRWVRSIALLLLMVSLVDQTLNVYGSYATVNGIYGGVGYMARWFRDNVPRDSVVIANALHADDIRFYSGNHIRTYWSVGTGVPPERTLERPDELERFLQRHYGSTPILMLNIDQQFSPAKADYHAHKYVTRRLVSLTAGRRVHEVVIRFPFVDPLRQMLPRQKVLFLGPPDLENDVYNGHDQRGRYFLNEVSVAYDVHTVAGPGVSRSAYFMPDSTFRYPRLIESYRGYGVYGYRDRLFAVPDVISADEQTLAQAKTDQRIFVGSSLEELHDEVDRTLKR